MEKDFQTSFIPKKPMMEEQATQVRPVGFLTIISVFIFLTMFIATTAIYFYKDVLSKNVTEMKNNLNLAQNRFEPSKIVQLQVLDKRLRAATEILSQHTAISPIFQTLQDITMKSVRYTKFDYIFGENSKIDVKMSGIAIGYRSIALQSDLFTQNKFLINPVFSNLSLDNIGNVVFDLEFSIDPSFIDYQQTLKVEDNNSLNGI